VIEEFNLNTQDPFTRLLAACFAFQDERDSLRNVVSLAVEQNAALGAEVATLKRVVAAADAMRLVMDSMYHGVPDIKDCTSCTARNIFDAARAAMGKGNDERHSD
jgi:hypothetical protein